MKLYLIDGSSIAYRGHFAFIRNPLRNSKGENTSAVFGFLNSILKLLSEQNPSHLLVAFDAPGPTARHRKFKEYKAQRPKMPEELRRQLPIIKELLSSLGISFYEKEGLEADDIIANLAGKAVDDNFEVVIFSGDKDFLQLLNEKIKILNPRDFKIYNNENAKELLGVLPEQVVDFLALSGDSIDNIPGVKGIGPKTAQKLLEKFNSLDGIYKNLNRIENEKTKKLLIENKEIAYLSRELVKPIMDEESVINIKETKRKEINEKELTELLSNLEFFSIIEKLGLSSAVDIPVIKTKDVLSGDIMAVTSIADFTVIATEEGASILKDKDATNELLNRPRLIVTDNCKDLTSSKEKEIFDVAIASYLLEPSLGVNSLPKASLKYLSRPFPSPKKNATRDEIEKCALIRSSIILSLYPVLKEELKKKELEKIYYDMEIPLSKVLSKMEKRGVLLDMNFFQETGNVLKQKLNDLEKEIYKEAGMGFNINSPKQLSYILFEKLGLPRQKRTKTGASTDYEVLLKLSPYHRIIELLLNYRETEKLRSTYIDAFPKLIQEDGRVRTKWCQTSTATGRLSSLEPNLQNIPEMVRKGLVAPPGFKLLSADYSQIELRIVASLSGDKNLKCAFERGDDIHTKTASLILGIVEGLVGKKERDLAKMINFGIIYGMGAWGLSRRLGIPLKDARIFINAYFKTYPGVKDWVDKTIRDVSEKGYTTTMLGRKRYFDDIKTTDIRAAINAPVQGSAADLIKIAMINLDKALSGTENGITIQVHDELVLEVKEEELNEISNLVRKEMENAISLDIPILCDIKVGENWGEMREIVDY